jgi:hypothetical protein
VIPVCKSFSSKSKNLEKKIMDKIKVGRIYYPSTDKSTRND